MTADTSFALEPSLELELLQLWKKFLNRSDLTLRRDSLQSGRCCLDHAGDYTPRSGDA